MVDEISALYQKVLVASYDMYGDLNGINSAMVKIGAMLGTKRLETPSLGFAPSVKAPQATGEPMRTVGTGATQSIKPEEKASPERSHEIGKGVNPVIEMQTYVKPAVDKPKLQAAPNVSELKKVNLPVGEHKDLGYAVPPEAVKKESLAHMESRVSSMKAVAVSTPLTQNIETPMVEAPVVQSTEWANAGISNPLSDLLNLTKSRGSLTVSEAADTLHFDRSLIERWARILSDNSLLKLKYQLIGDMILEA